MGYSRDDEWGTNQKVYADRQIEAVLTKLGIDIRDDTENDYISLCPYHGNTYTPAFSTSKTTGVSYCFNPACNVGGHTKYIKGVAVESQGVTLEQLVKDIKHTNYFETKRFIQECETEETVSYLDRLQTAMEVVPEFVPFDKADNLEVWYQEFWESQNAQDYMMYERGFTEETLREFYVGYSSYMNMVEVPMYDPTGNIPVGLIGRIPDPTDKTFKNSKGLPKSQTMWNLHRARRYETVIVVEASFDAMRVHQAGYKNVVALLGGSISPAHVTLFKRHFSGVVIMTDDDKPRYDIDCKRCKRAGHDICQGHQPGRVLGENIVARLPQMKISWAGEYGETVYPHGAKDAGDMTDEEIRACLRGAVGTLEYEEWLN